ncbi:hypothetical protein ACA910_004717 [Epithemia clementina (nom. ined.)]
MAPLVSWLSSSSSDSTCCPPMTLVLDPTPAISSTDSSSSPSSASSSSCSVSCQVEEEEKDEPGRLLLEQRQHQKCQSSPSKPFSVVQEEETTRILRTTKLSLTPTAKSYRSKNSRSSRFCDKTTPPSPTTMALSATTTKSLITLYGGGDSRNRDKAILPTVATATVACSSSSSSSLLRITPENSPTTKTTTTTPSEQLSLNEDHIQLQKPHVSSTWKEPSSSPAAAQTPHTTSRPPRSTNHANDKEHSPSNTARIFSSPVSPVGSLSSPFSERRQNSNFGGCKDNSLGDYYNQAATTTPLSSSIFAEEYSPYSSPASHTSPVVYGNEHEDHDEDHDQGFQEFMKQRAFQFALLKQRTRALELELNRQQQKVDYVESQVVVVKPSTTTKTTTTTTTTTTQSEQPTSTTTIAATIVVVGTTASHNGHENDKDHQQQQKQPKGGQDGEVPTSTIQAVPTFCFDDNLHGDDGTPMIKAQGVTDHTRCSMHHDCQPQTGTGTESGSDLYYPDDECQDDDKENDTTYSSTMSDVNQDHHNSDGTPAHRRQGTAKSLQVISETAILDDKNDDDDNDDDDRRQGTPSRPELMDDTCSDISDDNSGGGSDQSNSRNSQQSIGTVEPESPTIRRDDTTTTMDERTIDTNSQTTNVSVLDFSRNSSKHHPWKKNTSMQQEAESIIVNLARSPACRQKKGPIWDRHHTASRARQSSRSFATRKEPNRDCSRAQCRKRNNSSSSATKDGRSTGLFKNDSYNHVPFLDFPRRSMENREKYDDAAGRENTENTKLDHFKEEQDHQRRTDVVPFLDFPRRNGTPLLMLHDERTVDDQVSVEGNQTDDDLLRAWSYSSCDDNQEETESHPSNKGATTTRSMRQKQALRYAMYERFRVLKKFQRLLAKRHERYLIQVATASNQNGNTTNAGKQTTSSQQEELEAENAEKYYIKLQGPVNGPEQSALTSPESKPLVADDNGGQSRTSPRLLPPNEPGPSTRRFTLRSKISSLFHVGATTTQNPLPPPGHNNFDEDKKATSKSNLVPTGSQQHQQPEHSNTQELRQQESVTAIGSLRHFSLSRGIDDDDDGDDDVDNDLLKDPDNAVIAFGIAAHTDFFHRPSAGAKLATPSLHRHGASSCSRRQPTPIVVQL